MGGAAQPITIKGNGLTPRPKVEVVNLPKGVRFARVAMAIALGKGSMSDTMEYAKRWKGQTPEVFDAVKHMMTKAIEGTAVVGSPAWGGELVNPNTAMTEFVELLMPETIIGKVRGFDEVPFNIPIITQTGGSTFDWVEEGDPKPVGELAFERDTMGWAKCAGIVVITEELARLSDPKAEQRVRDDMIKQCRKFLDEQFIRVGNTAGTSSPASITNGVASPAASGTDVEALRLDLMTAMQTFTAASIPLTGLVIVMPPEIALGISLMTNALGQTPNGFNVTPTGGTLLGFQVIVSESVDPGTIVIFKPSEIFLADDGQVRIDASNQATLDMAGGSTPTFSLWQTNCIALRAERWINWKKKRAAVVAIIDTAAYAPSGS
jgi:HK97 family phage major capsid protein